MWNWLVAFFTALFSLVPHATTQPHKNRVPVVAAEAAYSALIPETTPVKPKVPRSKCTTCGGTGRVRSGDGQGWTECPDCEDDGGTPSSTPTKR
ncbi:hypothetical protein EBZ39_01830 [bacterium]|nr:hypothetical protein [bacterium]